MQEERTNGGTKESEEREEGEMGMRVTGDEGGRTEKVVMVEDHEGMVSE